METLQWRGVGQRPDAGSHGWMTWACERKETPTLAKILPIPMLAFCEDSFINRSLWSNTVKLVNKVAGSIKSFFHSFIFPVTIMVIRLLYRHCLESSFIKPVLF
jgi:hypothetical protein